MNAYRHTVQYYETDRMGIVHHSNYIRWMEEARVDYLAQLGWGLERLEAMGARCVNATCPNVLHIQHIGVPGNLFGRQV